MQSSKTTLEVLEPSFTVSAEVVGEVSSGIATTATTTIASTDLSLIQTVLNFITSLFGF